MVDRLAGKIAIVTGAASGIGEAVARRFHAEGARVALFDVDRDALSAVADSLAGACSEHIDVTCGAEVEAGVARVVERLGPPNVLVNNAGTVFSGSIEEMPEDQWDRIFEVNVKSVYLVSRAVLPFMRLAGGGSIVNMASESAFIGFPMHHAYCATKAAVVQLTRCMATRYAAEAIRVNALCPGTIDTPLYRRFLAMQPDPAKVDADVRALHPLGIGAADDIAYAAVYLASDESRYTTGAPMLVEGGATAL
jgi:NAD(P)-dependent dehydrogenase (short-subunit alcohol dehydrogenase family)